MKTGNTSPGREEDGASDTQQGFNLKPVFDFCVAEMSSQGSSVNLELLMINDLICEF